jgi:hypothetical protein
VTKRKPQGVSGAVGFGHEGGSFRPIEFPAGKAEREELIANLFAKAFDQWVAGESTPSLKPFSNLGQNQENDLDFTVTTSDGEKLMELVEFAPLDQHGPKFEDAPAEMSPRTKANLCSDVVQKKSDHQGGADRFLVIYATEHGFWLDAFTIEWMRRQLSANPPRFDRVYYISVHDLESASVSEIFPGTPHHWFGELSDEKLDVIKVRLPHPKDVTSGIVKL